MKRSNDKLQVLLVEDDEIDRIAVRRAFRELGLELEIIEADDGAEALAIIEGRTDKPTPRSPFVILLDINMPRMSGHEFLSAIRSGDYGPQIRDAVVFVLSTSSAESDIKQAYARHVAGYLVKEDFDRGLLPVVEMIKSYSNVVELP